jgi:steroid 5-alpha reductase family enzyme
MSEAQLFPWLILAVFVAGAATFAALLAIPAPYGRHARAGWGPTLPAPWAWALMEAPSALAFALFFARGPGNAGLVPWVLFAMWQAHYLSRALFDPWAMRRRATRTPVLIAAMGAGYNVLNAYLNATSIVRFGPTRGPEWLAHPVAATGLLLFAAGYWVNREADARLRRLGEHGQGGYGVPRGWLYEHVSCPNYLGEIVEWCGWALVTASPAGASFAFFTACNLVPRAITHHRWYRRRFAAYPPARRALIPRLL